jgi:hypothetical protein
MTRFGLLDPIELSIVQDDIVAAAAVVVIVFVVSQNGSWNV